jgi:molybdenum cofactor biosynthesis enzyme MoaA
VKVLGFAKESYDTQYICIVTHEEIEKLYDQYYGKKGKLRIGEEVDLGAGYNWANKTISALAETRKFIEANQPIIQAILAGTLGLVRLADIIEPKVTP